MEERERRKTLIEWSEMLNIKKQDSSHARTWISKHNAAVTSLLWFHKNRSKHIIFQQWWGVCLHNEEPKITFHNISLNTLFIQRIEHLAKTNYSVQSPWKVDVYHQLPQIIDSELSKWIFCKYLTRWSVFAC